jgi:hypothetical protein
MKTERSGGKAAPAGVKIIAHIPFEPDYAEYGRLIRLDSCPDCRRQARETFETAAALLRPGALFLPCAVTRRQGTQVHLGSACFDSRLLCGQLAAGQTVFPYLATCGPEADGPAFAADPLTGFWLDTLKQMALTCALDHLRARIAADHAPGPLASLNPGSGEADLWPLEQQPELFTLFAGGEERIGVRLTASCLMVPNKSVSGIFFADTEGFNTCRFCSRPDCRRRRSAFTGKLPEASKRELNTSREVGC